MYRRCIHIHIHHLSRQFSCLTKPVYRTQVNSLGPQVQIVCQKFLHTKIDKDIAISETFSAFEPFENRHLGPTNEDVQSMLSTLQFKVS